MEMCLFVILAGPFFCVPIVLHWIRGKYSKWLVSRNLRLARRQLEKLVKEGDLKIEAEESARTALDLLEQLIKKWD